MSDVPPISDLDVFRAANQVIKLHGMSAEVHADERASTFEAAGDAGGYAVWVRIANAIRELLRKSGPLQ